MSISIISITFGASPTTAVPLSSGTGVASSVLIQAKGGNNAGTGKNQGKVFIGNSSVVGNSPTTGIQLAVPMDGVTPPSVRFESGDNSNLFPLSSIYVAGVFQNDGIVAFCHIVGS